MDERSTLSSQLVRCHALLWSIEDAKVKQAVRERIRSIEARIAQLDNSALPLSRAAAVTNRLGR